MTSKNGRNIRNAGAINNENWNPTVARLFTFIFVIALTSSDCWIPAFAGMTSSSQNIDHLTQRYCHPREHGDLATVRLFTHIFVIALTLSGCWIPAFAGMTSSSQNIDHLTQRYCHPREHGDPATVRFFTHIFVIVLTSSGCWIPASATAPALLYLLHPCSRERE